MFWLIFLNAAVALLVWATGLPPLFQTEVGSMPPRLYHNYLVTASEDNGLRFLSFFGEPSETVWLGTAALFLQLYFGNKMRAAAMAVSLAVTMSGSLLFAYILVAVCVAPRWAPACLGLTGYFTFRHIDAIRSYMTSIPGVSLIALRLFDKSGGVSLSRGAQFQDFARAFHLWPSPIVGDDVFSAPNGSFLLLLRFGILYAPLFASTVLLLLWYVRRGFSKSRYLGCFYISFLVRHRRNRRPAKHETWPRVVSPTIEECRWHRGRDFLGAQQPVF